MSNPDDIFEGSHAEFAAMESYVSPTDRRWEAFCDEVERLIGHPLDGDQGDGFSLDGADEAFGDQMTPLDYFKEVTGISPAVADDGDDEGRCTNPRGHSWSYTGSAYGGDDDSYHGEGRCYCQWCGTDGDA